MKTETTTASHLETAAPADLAQLADNEIDAVAGGIILGGPGPCKFYAPYNFYFYNTYYNRARI
jgi:hypothetical protein